MAQLCSVYEVDFRNLVEELKQSVAEQLTGKVHIVLAEPPLTHEKFKRVRMKRMICLV